MAVIGKIHHFPCEEGKRHGSILIRDEVFYFKGEVKTANDGTMYLEGEVETFFDEMADDVGFDF